MKINWTIVSLAAWLVLPAATSSAADVERTERNVSQQAEKKQVFGQRRAAKLAAEFKVSEAEVQALREKNMGWGEIRHALSLSQRSGRPLPEIVDLRESGMGWGEIAARYNVAPGEEKKSTIETISPGAAPSDSQGEGKQGRDVDRPMAPPAPQTDPNQNIP